MNITDQDDIIKCSEVSDFDKQDVIYQVKDLLDHPEVSTEQFILVCHGFKLQLRMRFFFQHVVAGAVSKSNVVPYTWYL